MLVKMLVQLLVNGGDGRRIVKFHSSHAARNDKISKENYIAQNLLNVANYDVLEDKVLSFHFRDNVIYIEI